VNPASPVLYEVDASIDRWANAAFGALSGEKTQDEWYAAYADLPGTLWAAIDIARRKAPTWPPIAFVASFDNTGGDLPKAIITRHRRE
jgi:hypothetical protein